MRRLPLGQISAGFSTNQRKAVVFGVDASHNSNRHGGWQTTGAASLTFRPTPSLVVEISPEVTHSSTIAQYLKTVDDPIAAATFGHRYVFSDIEQIQVTMPVRFSWTFSPRASLQLYMQPLVASGDYWGFKQLAAPRTFDFARFGRQVGTMEKDASGRYTVDPDGAGPAASFGFADPDFNYKSLQVNAVFRWEWRLGSALYAVWTQRRADYANPGTFDAGRDLSALTKAPADNVFMLKVTYWLSR
jgi:hypothetical protein